MTVSVTVTFIACVFCAVPISCPLHSYTRRGQSTDFVWGFVFFVPRPCLALILRGILVLAWHGLGHSLEQIRRLSVGGMLVIIAA